MMVSKRRVDDIPEKYFKRIGHPLPYQGLIVDRDRQHKFFRHVWKNANEVKENEREQLDEKLNSFFPANPGMEKAMATQSVRTMWDLYLQVRQFPKGSEILFTGITIPDMTRIAEEHGLIPVPIDLEIHTLMPRLEDIVRSTSSKTVAMIFAYVYGVTYDISSYVPFLKANNIEIIEDCA